MKLPEISYELGVQQAFREYLEKTAKIPGASEVRSFIRALSGRGVKETASENLRKIMNLPAVKAQAKKTPDMTPVRTYVQKTLQKKPHQELGRVKKYIREKLVARPEYTEETRLGRLKNRIRNVLTPEEKDRSIPRLEDIQSALSASEGEIKQRKQLLNALKAGQKKVYKQKMSTRKARLGLGGALAVPLVGVPALSKESALFGKDESSNAIPAGVGAAVGAAPIAQGIKSKALRLGRRKGPAMSLDELKRVLKPGDIILTSHPGWNPTKYKPAITALGADPYTGYHVMNVTNVAKNPEHGFSAVEASPGSGGAFAQDAGFSKDVDYTIRRFKDPKHTKEFIKNLKRYAKREAGLENLLGGDAVKTMYDKPASIRAAIGSMLPNFANRLLHKATSEGGLAATGQAVCSSLTGMCSPVPLVEGIPGEHILPHHVATSKALETVGSSYAKRTGKELFEEMLHRVSPWAVRGLLGAGLGYGAYRGIKALTD